eukprot:TRINITY_DN364_c0_g1_i1.p1 TRINITY_DN364_c0_g1~~TRINITY_DN364_c0_g1_i1.p1  ORF type:complete len:187 (-),score=40.21 TRINITY_DN364_c0_g1_i1:118-678(-)
MQKSSRLITLGLILVSFMALAQCQNISAIVTFLVVDIEAYKIEVISQSNLDIACSWLRGEVGPLIPVGNLIRNETDVNVGWSWHVDPASLNFVDATVELCDAIPSMIEDGSFTVDYFCPWAAQPVKVDGYNCYAAQSTPSPSPSPSTCVTPTPTCSTPTPSPSCNGKDNDQSVEINFYFADILRGL